ncbi:2OG-Fe(II) oxygenase family protein [Euzebya tangerina]|uniref:2OG-Fe(II) oxygenase family protein n=1 Tax=Euzebya tangerina TaxID=591198 RepID=UPI000E31551C|nr:2OG-Fe(II) oxygenase [Euzebya tangerina]
MSEPHPGPAPLLESGLRAPDFVLPVVGQGRPTRFYGAAGGEPLILLFGRERLSIHRLSDRPGDDDPIEPAPTLDLVDAGGKVAGQYGAQPGDVIVLDPALRCLGALRPEQVPDDPIQPAETFADTGLRAAVASLISKVSTADRQIVAAQAPVLLIPNVLTSARCRWLIDLWSTGGAAETGVEMTEEETRADVINAKRKRRRDLIIQDQGTTNVIAQIVGKAVMPEVRRAFAYRATRFEGFKVGNYHADSDGFFSAHRDNLSPATLHRRFALSLNLNDAYEGGEVRFPEYGDQRYRPPAGGALVFSGSLLHEVLPVTAGERFVLLSFLYGDDVKRSATA